MHTLITLYTVTVSSIYIACLYVCLHLKHLKSNGCLYSTCASPLWPANTVLLYRIYFLVCKSGCNHPKSVLMDFCYTFNQVWFVDCLCFVYFYLLELKMCGLIWEGWYCRHGLLQVHINLNPGLVYFSNGC